VEEEVHRQFIIHLQFIYNSFTIHLQFTFTYNSSITILANRI